MTLHDVLTETRRLGIELEVTDGRLTYRAPAGVLTPGLRAMLVQRKPDLLPVVWRLDAMRRLHRDAPRPAVYARESAQGGPGRCFSCGDMLDHPEAYGRCVPCDIASDLFYATRDGDAEVFA